jgi:Tol biopolymer transport system component
MSTRFARIFCLSTALGLVGGCAAGDITDGGEPPTEETPDGPDGPVGWARIGGNGDSVIAALSHNGAAIALSSLASDLVADDANEAADAFLARLDPMTGAVTIQRASVASDGSEARRPQNRHESDDWTFTTSLSADGSTVSFMSRADNLVDNDQNRAADLFVHDVANRLTERANVSSDGAESKKEDAPLGTVSGDGRYVAFYSTSYSLVPDAGCTGVYLHDRVSKTTSQMSLTWDGRSDTGCTYWGNGEASISQDATSVAFTFRAGELVRNLSGDHIQVFLRDVGTGKTTLVSVALGGGAGNGLAESPVISANGRAVAFWSAASDLVAGDGNDTGDIFVRDLNNGGMERVSVANDGSEANGPSYSPALSASGRYVVFVSSASNLVPGDDNDLDDVFVRDRYTGMTERVSVGMAGEANGASGPAVISGDGRTIGFSSAADNLLPGDDNGAVDIFLVPNPLAD